MILKILKLLFSSNASNTINGYWCETEIKLSSKISTPLGSKVSVVNVCVDVSYNYIEGKIQIINVYMSKNDSGIMGSSQYVNMTAARSGEGWYDKGTIPNLKLKEIVLQELSSDQSKLHKLISDKEKIKLRTNQALHQSP